MGAKKYGGELAIIPSSILRARHSAPALPIFRSWSRSEALPCAFTWSCIGSPLTSGEYVVPGNILMRQRGQKFRPGQHVGMGRDHTLVALQPGYVVYYEHHLPYPHQSEPKMQPPKSMEMFKVGGIDDGSKVTRKLVQPEEMPMVKFPRAMKRFIGIVRTPEETLPRDEREEGRERYCWTTDGKEGAVAGL